MQHILSKRAAPLLSKRAAPLAPLPACECRPHPLAGELVLSFSKMHSNNKPRGGVNVQAWLLV